MLTKRDFYAILLTFFNVNVYKAHLHTVHITMYVQCMYSLCKVYYVCTVYVTASVLCTMYVQCMYSLCKVYYVQSM